jgi:hypothetical protein
MKYIYYVLLLSGLCILLVRRDKVDRRLLLFIPLLFFAIVTELSYDLWRSFFVYHIYQGIECTLLCAYYYLLLQRKPFRRWILLAWLAYLCYFTAFFIHFPQRFFHYDPIDFVVEDVFVTIFSLYYLIDLYRSDEEVQIFQHPHFWITAGNLLFYAGASLFMGLAFTLMTQNKTWYLQLGNIVKFLNLVLYFIYIKAFLCHSPEKALA